MNERIQQLEKQSYTEVMHEMGGMYMAFDKEKFAELIVQECIVQIQLTTARDPQTSAQYKQSVGHIHRIRKHFGVEE
jgi:hypothetical protein